MASQTGVASSSTLVIPANATTLIKPGSGMLFIVAGFNGAGNITIYDSATTVGAGTSNIMCIIAAGTTFGPLNMPFSNGLVVATPAGVNASVFYN